MHYVYRFRREAERGREAGGERSGVRTQIGPPLILKDEVRAPPRPAHHRLISARGSSEEPRIRS